MSEPRFECLEVLGRGASGMVRRARLVEPFAGLAAGSEVAVKTLAPELVGDARALESFEAESEAGRLVDDPSLVRVLHHGVGEDGPYLLLSFVPGRSLEEILAEEGPLPEPLVRSVAAQLAGALSALHAAGIVHGDVKPENVRLDAAGRAVLLDLGFALHVGDDGTSHAGTLAYLAPERARAEPPSPEADVWALGVTVFELATGAHPLAPVRRRPGHVNSLLGRSSARLLQRAVAMPDADELLVTLATGRPATPSRLVPTLSAFLDAIVAACLRRAPRERIAAATLAEALQSGEGGDWWRARVEDVRHDGAAGAGEAGVDELPLVGRERELARLDALWTQVIDGAPAPHGTLSQEPPRTGPIRRLAVVWLVGAEGSGKWRLVHEFALRARVGPRPPLFLAARWREPSESRPGGAALEWLARWLELPPGTPPGTRERERLLAHVPPDDARTLFAALDPRGEDDLDASVPTALARWTASLARERPLVLALDDVHRAGAVTLEALSALLSEVGLGRVLVVLSVREDVPPAEPELYGELRAGLERRASESTRHDLRFVRLELGPIDEPALEELVRELFHHSTPRLRLTHALWRATRGNPGLAAEVLRELVRRGEAVPFSEEEPQLRLLVPPDDLPQPRSLEQLLAERLSVLAPEDRGWLERLAVLGGRIDPELLVRTGVASTHAELDPVLSRLVKLGWLVPVGARYRFERPTLRDAVYRGLSPGRRARLHLDVARALASDAGVDESTEDAYLRAYHLRMAREDEEVLRLALELVERLKRRASAQRLYTLASWGLDALDALPPTPEHDRARVTLLEFASDATDRLGRRETQRRLLDRLTDLELDPERRPGLAARVYLLHGRYAASTGQLGLARGMFRNARELATAARDGALTSEATRRLAHVQGQVGELVAARGLAERARLLAEGPNQLALVDLEIALLDILDDRLEDAVRGVDHALATVRDADDVRQGVYALAYVLRCRAWRAAGRPDRAHAAIRRALDTARRAGERQLESEARARLGVVLLDLDRPEEAEQELRDALLSADEIEDRRGQVLAHVFLSLLLWEQDDRTARAGLRRGIDLAAEVGYYRAEALALAVLARVQRAAGELVAADRDSARALALLESHGAELGDRIAIVGTRALVLASIGRDREGRALVRALRRRMREANHRIKDSTLRRSQRAHSTALLEAVLSEAGPIFPRVGT